jgi:hypothetical protein
LQLPISYTISTVATIVAFLIIFGRANREMLAERAALAKADALHGATEEVTETNEELSEANEELSEANEEATAVLEK